MGHGCSNTRRIGVGGRGSTRWHGSRKGASVTTRRCRPIPEEVPMFEEALLILLAIGALVLLF